MSGDADELTRSREVLLDALSALGDHADNVVVVGAHAVYLRTLDVELAVAPLTSDSDLLLDARNLAPEPLIESAMTAAGFRMRRTKDPGCWESPDGVPVDLMVPETIAGKGRRRAADIEPHCHRVARRSKGLEAALVDRSRTVVPSLAADDRPSIVANVAGPMALIVAKQHKIHERLGSTRLSAKDAHDVYRLLVAVDTPVLVQLARVLLAHPLSAEVTREAIGHLGALFAAGPDARGSAMAGEAEAGVGDPDVVAASTAALAADLLDAIGTT